MVSNWIFTKTAYENNVEYLMEILGHCFVFFHVSYCMVEQERAQISVED